MQPRTVFRAMTVLALLAVLAGLLAAPSSAAPSASGRYLVLARSAADLGGLRARAVADGAKVVRAIPQINALVVKASATAKRRLAADRRALGVAPDRLTQPDRLERARPDLSSPGLRGAQRIAARPAAAARGGGIDPDPAWDYRGLLWDYRRMGLPRGWRETAGVGMTGVGAVMAGDDERRQVERSE